MLDSDAEVPQEVLAEYEKLLKRSYTENFDDLYKTDLLKVIGKDGYGSHIVLLIPCFIVASGADPEKTLRYAILTLDPIVKENYVLILCETHTNWLTDAVYAYAKQWYDTLPRKYKKNLKNLYLVHSGFLSKTLLTIVTPFISPKFWKKVEYIEKLEDLFLKLNIKASKYLKYFPYIVQRNEEVMLGGQPISPFGADLEILCQRFGKKYLQFKHIPSILIDFLTHLTKPEIINTKDLFNLQADAATLYGIIGDIEYGEPTTDFNNIPSLVCSFKLFLNTQKHGLLGKDAFSRLHYLKSTSASDKIIKLNLSKLYQKLTQGIKQCVLCLLHFFKTISEHASENNMTILTLSKIFAPTFFRSKTPNAIFTECISLANKCMQMIIQNPDILMNPEKYNEQSSESISSYESGSENNLTEDENKSDISKSDISKSDDSKSDVSKTDDSKSDDSKSDDSKSDENNSEECKDENNKINNQSDEDSNESYTSRESNSKTSSLEQSSEQTSEYSSSILSDKVIKKKISIKKSTSKKLSFDHSIKSEKSEDSKNSFLSEKTDEQDDSYEDSEKEEEEKKKENLKREPSNDD
ncbi:rhoGAP GTPase, putative [Plasmodium sp. gorilla clade G2]|uniref:rhoGAP GTPase, putative n=1 Tax=Plasmodium sp. gorilla clade G2 TaxID=880535 RepID=UPI000D221850|nr:rhoGAP GTPase, putative [Plasmodium sp. gorilla clade G2]SOV14650.1 rhoGAP GTPase, putative [Plasmodium sp. gorilla clade G2]